MRPIRVLFLCTGNSARSVIAEALLGRLGDADFEVRSAGTHPRGINPFTLRVLSEQGIDASEFHSKPVDHFIGQDFDYVITVCDSAAEECPVFPGAPQRIHWSFVDPAVVEGPDLVKLAAFRETERGMRNRIQSFIPAALRSRQAATSG
jgi:arsenate reductase (thioredoxin)